nr:sulfatase-like hydrolase/transferase [uncultured Butyrivibrio sp.]
MFAHSSGLPLKVLTNLEDGNFYPNVVSIGDILKKEGYYQELLIGSKAAFGAREQFYSQHGNYSIFDYDTAVEKGLIPEDYFEFWGYEDEKLFEYAKGEVLRLSKGEQPFNLTILTVDTHFEDGYICNLCREDYLGEQYSNVMACSSRQVSEFLNWIKKQDFYDDTTIVINGDHPTMDKDYCLNVPKDYQRKTYTAFVNSAVTKMNDDYREYSTMDLFPTTLAAMGVYIPGDRLALGSNLFSDKPTLVERYGIDNCNSLLARKSTLMNELADFSIDDDMIQTIRDNTKFGIYDLDLEGNNVRFRAYVDDCFPMDMIDCATIEVKNHNGKVIDRVKVEIQDRIDNEDNSYLELDGELSFDLKKYANCICKLCFKASGGETFEVACLNEPLLSLKNAIGLPAYLKLIDSNNEIVFISVKDDGSYSITDADLEVLSKLGVNTDLRDAFRKSFYAVIDSEKCIEEISEEPLFNSGVIGENRKYTIQSEGFECGNMSAIIIDGKEYSKNLRGLNIVVYDKNVGNVIDSVSFDMYNLGMKW